MFKKLVLMVAAFGLGMLIAPKEGSETRRDVKRKFEDFKKKVGK